MKHNLQLRFVLTFSILIMFSACSHKAGRYTQRHDAAPAKHVEVSKIPDAVPLDEPRSRYGNPDSYVVFGKKYYTLKSSKDYVKQGTASWYGTKFHGHRTSSGETYDMYAMTAAHKSLPLPTYARVTNLDNGRSVVVKINDRGPFHDNRLIDLSYAAATKLDIMQSGTVRVEVRTLQAGDVAPNTQTTDATLSSTPKVMAIPASATVTTTKDLTSDMYLQLGAFSNEDNARRLLKKLADSNFEGVHITEAVSNDQRIYRVRIGPLETADNANNLASLLESHGVVSPSIVID